MKHLDLESRFIIFRKLSEEQIKRAIEQARKNGRIAEARTEKAMKIRYGSYSSKQNYK